MVDREAPHKYRGMILRNHLIVILEMHRHVRATSVEQVLNTPQDSLDRLLSTEHFTPSFQSKTRPLPPQVSCCPPVTCFPPSLRPSVPSFLWLTAHMAPAGVYGLGHDR